MRSIIVKNGRMISANASKRDLSLILKAEGRETSIPKNAPLPIELFGYELLHPDASNAPIGDIVKEIDPIFTGGRWVQQWSVKGFTEDDLAAYKLEVKAKIAAKKYEVETSAESFSSTREDQSMMASAVLTAILDPTEVFDFKGPDGVHRSITAEEIKTNGLALSRWVQSCFSHEKALFAKVDAATTKKHVDKVNYTTGWPSEYGEPDPETTTSTSEIKR